MIQLVKKLPSSLTHVTKFSKMLALLIIVAFMLSAFYAGIVFQQKYSPTLSSITPTPTPVVSAATACVQDSDCILASSDIPGTCCPNIKCLNFADSRTVALNGAWLNEARSASCGKKIMCPMIAVMCPRGIVEENAHYSARCVQHVCTKVRS